MLDCRKAGIYGGNSESSPEREAKTKQGEGRGDLTKYKSDHFHPAVLKSFQCLPGRFRVNSKSWGCLRALSCACLQNVLFVPALCSHTLAPTTILMLLPLFFIIYFFLKKHDNQGKPAGESSQAGIRARGSYRRKGDGIPHREHVQKDMAHERPG